MNLAEAIEINSDFVKQSKLDYLPDIRGAIKLGIEALEAIEQFRSGSDTRHLWRLPSETED